MTHQLQPQPHVDSRINEIFTLNRNIVVFNLLIWMLIHSIVFVESKGENMHDGRYVYEKYLFPLHW